MSSLPFVDTLGQLDVYMTSLICLLSIVLIAQVRTHIKRFSFSHKIEPPPMTDEEAACTSTHSDTPTHGTHGDTPPHTHGDSATHGDTTHSTACTSKPIGFVKLQIVYLSVYLICNGADWLQGPYVYALYQEYGFNSTDIGLLFVVGFAVSGVFGTFVGALTDTWGRKFMCMSYCVIYTFGCVTKHFADFYILMIGRFLCGISTSILFSGFDAWIVHELQTREYEKSLVSETFQKATFWNGFVAIFSGILASVAADKRGKVAPFDLSAVCLCIAFIMIIVLWSENYGVKQTNTHTHTHTQTETRASIMQSVKEAVYVCIHERDVLYCGLIQSCFESAMYIFVFSWTPSLPSSVNHGLIFACFMSAVMLGSMFVSYLSTDSDTRVLNVACIVGAAAFVPCVIFTNEYIRFAMFIIFELIVGIYFPKFYTLRSEIVPGDKRATILNLYRLPLNTVVVIVCGCTGHLSVETTFFVVVVLLVGAFLATEGLIRERKKQCADGKGGVSELAKVEA